MKEVEKKDVPDVSGGYIGDGCIPFPPIDPDYPPNPIGPVYPPPNPDEIVV
jgi:hypothetical protein